MLDLLSHAVDGVWLYEHGEGAGIMAIVEAGAHLSSPFLALDRRLTFILSDEDFAECSFGGLTDAFERSL